ncbi:hypothetical protein AVEN_143525-1 [Araneus ventricosus]|uniref:Secreted protein n=1 Tax=Araneus ventricosus TaxID=182803 RepID=A0A4Y2RG67_ARAVE|nr:hypothetical protein AVEN_143525-1 [Araneus ventricosus]
MTIRRLLSLLHVAYIECQTSNRWCGAEAWTGVSAQMSSDRGSKLRRPPHNSPRVASNQDMIITKLTRKVWSNCKPSILSSPQDSSHDLHPMGKQGRCGQ